MVEEASSLFSVGKKERAWQARLPPEHEREAGWKRQPAAFLQEEENVLKMPARRRGSVGPAFRFSCVRPDVDTIASHTVFLGDVSLAEDAQGAGRSSRGNRTSPLGIGR